MRLSSRITPLQGLQTQIYKIVRFNRSRCCLPGLIDHSRDEHHDCKLDPSLSRARSAVLQIALCNDWEYFFTGTLDQLKMDRYDLKEFNRALSQWIRDMRKKYGPKIEFLVVPEMHKDGAWHSTNIMKNQVYAIDCENFLLFDNLCTNYKLALQHRKSFSLNLFIS